MVDGLQELDRRWTRVPQQVRTEVHDAMESGAEEVVRTMRHLAPKGDFGDLVRSIDWTWGAAPEGSMTLASANAGTASGGANMTITIFAGNKSTLVTNQRGHWFQNARIQEFGARRGPKGFAGPGMWRQPNPYFFNSWRIWKRRIQVQLTRAINRALAR